MVVLAEMLGCGTLLVLAVYMLFSFGWLKNGIPFQGANLVGSVALMISNYYYGAWPSVALTTIWGANSAIALVRLRPRIVRDRSMGEVAEAATYILPVKLAAALLRGNRDLRRRRKYIGRLAASIEPVAKLLRAAAQVSAHRRRVLHTWNAA